MDDSNRLIRTKSRKEEGEKGRCWEIALVFPFDLVDVFCFLTTIYGSLTEQHTTMNALLSMSRKDAADLGRAPPTLPLGIASLGATMSVGKMTPDALGLPSLNYQYVPAAAGGTPRSALDSDEDDVDEEGGMRKRRKIAAIGTAGYHMFLQDLYAGAIPGIGMSDAVISVLLNVLCVGHEYRQACGN